MCLVLLGFVETHLELCADIMFGYENQGAFSDNQFSLVGT